MVFVNYFLEKIIGINLLNKPADVIKSWINDGIIYNILIEKILAGKYKLFMTDSNGIKVDFPEKTVLYMNKYNGKYNIMYTDKIYYLYDDVEHYELHINDTVWDIRFDTEWTIEKRQNNINTTSVS
jgi:hypothetical protein